MRNIVKPLDFLILVLIVFVALAIAFSPVFSAPEYAVIYVDGVEFGRYDLNDRDVKEVEISTKYGSNTVVIENSSVKVINSSCKDKIEINSGAISRTGQSLVCLPNRMVVKIEGGETFDATTF